MFTEDTVNLSRRVMLLETMEAVVGVAIAVLAVVFLGSLLALILVCRHRYCHRSDLLSKHVADSRPDVHLISSLDDLPEVELDEMRLHPDIEKILDDDQWIDDATGLIPHCLAILKTCHQLTEQLVAMTMTSIPQTHHRIWEIIEVARKISPRVDDVVRSMYPPLDPRLLEARLTAVILSVTHLSLVTRSVCNVTSFDWIEESLTEMDGHIKVLRDAAVTAEEIAQGNSEIQTTILNNNNIL